MEEPRYLGSSVPQGGRFFDTTQATFQILDRVAQSIIETAEHRGELQQWMKIIENTGIGLTLVGVQKSNRVVRVMPENVSEERKKIIIWEEIYEYQRS